MKSRGGSLIVGLVCWLIVESGGACQVVAHYFAERGGLQGAYMLAVLHKPAGDLREGDQIIAAKRAAPQADVRRWEREIDRLVYQLYELTDEEIVIVEGASAQR